jgi:hypothetical protein
MDSIMQSVFQLVMLMAWTCLADTPFNKKRTEFARFFTSREALETYALAASLSFAPGLLDVLQADLSPKLDFFKSLPTETLHYWGVYVIVLEKPNHPAKIYIGTGTALAGIGIRFRQYDMDERLPSRMHIARIDGYEITHKGLLCWMKIPPPALVPISRLLFILLEATFAYAFWAMDVSSEHRFPDMRHLCRWEIDEIEYPGLCSHCCLDEGFHGDFDLTAEQLEAQAEEKEGKRLLMKADNATNYHYKQMAENYDEYVTNANARVAKSRALNPGRDAKHQAN